MLSSAGLMNSFATTRYANFTRGCVMARTIVEITLMKTQTCVVGWNCHSQGFPLKTLDGYFISPYFSIIQEGIFHCGFMQGFKQLFFILYIYIYSFVFSVFSGSHQLSMPFQSQQNIPALLRGRSGAEMITSVSARIKSATRWMTVVTTRMRNSVVSSEYSVSCSMDQHPYVAIEWI